MGERDIGARSDVYALGRHDLRDAHRRAALHRAQLPGHRREGADGDSRRRSAPSARRSRPPSSTPSSTALQKLPADRYGSAKDFADALDGKGSGTTPRRWRYTDATRALAPYAPFAPRRCSPPRHCIAHRRGPRRLALAPPRPPRQFPANASSSGNIPAAACSPPASASSQPSPRWRPTDRASSTPIPSTVSTSSCGSAGASAMRSGFPAPRAPWRRSSRPMASGSGMSPLMAGSAR